VAAGALWRGFSPAAFGHSPRGLFHQSVVQIVHPLASRHARQQLFLLFVLSLGRNIAQALHMARHRPVLAVANAAREEHLGASHLQSVKAKPDTGQLGAAKSAATRAG
jgi:hypothetical protein